MFSSIITFLLPVLQPLAIWGIKTFISNQVRKQELINSFYAWVASHKEDGNNSAALGVNYQDQLNELKKKAEAQDAAGGQNGSDSQSKGKPS